MSAYVVVADLLLLLMNGCFGYTIVAGNGYCCCTVVVGVRLLLVYDCRWCTIVAGEHYARHTHCDLRCESAGGCMRTTTAHKNCLLILFVLTW